MKGWKLDGKYTVRIMRQRVEELESQGYETHVDRFTGVLYFRKKKKSRVQKAKPIRDYASQKFLEQKRREKLQERIWKLFAIWFMLLVSLVFVSGERPQYAYADNFEVNLSPVRFTEQELKALEDRSEQIAEEKKLSAYTDTEKVITKYFGKDTDWALRCLKSENARHNPYAINVNRNLTQDIGIFQVNTPVHCGKVGKNISIEECRKQLMDVETNVRVAKQIFDGSGKNAWYGKTCR